MKEAAVGEPRTAQEWRDAQAEEYSQWVAAGPVYTTSGAMAYGRGYPIPAGNVDPDTGRVAMERHVCHPDDHDEADCDQRGEVTVWSEPGLAVPAKKPATSPATSGKAAGKKSTASGASAGEKEG